MRIWVGVETSGRPVIVEIKLEKNRDARRAVVAQILAYATHLHGTTRDQLEDLVSASLRRRGHESLVSAVGSVQEDAFDADEFNETLREGCFRLVFVLDAVPPELMNFVACLEHVTYKLVIDLVAVNSFNVAGASVMIPQAVTPERHEVTIEKTRRREPGATFHKGNERFEASIAEAPAEHHKDLHRLLRWARELENRGLATLSSTMGKRGERFVLSPPLESDRVALATIRNGGARRCSSGAACWNETRPATSNGSRNWHPPGSGKATPRGSSATNYSRSSPTHTQKQPARGTHTGSRQPSRLDKDGQHSSHPFTKRVEPPGSNSGRRRNMDGTPLRVRHATARITSRSNRREVTWEVICEHRLGRQCRQYRWRGRP